MFMVLTKPGSAPAGKIGGSGSAQTHPPPPVPSKGTHIPGWRQHILKTFQDDFELHVTRFQCNIYVLLQIPFAKNIYGLIAPNFGVGFAIGKSHAPGAST